jgi:hypothetical protein
MLVTELRLLATVIATSQPPPGFLELPISNSLPRSCSGLHLIQRSVPFQTAALL